MCRSLPSRDRALILSQQPDQPPHSIPILTRTCVRRCPPQVRPAAGELDRSHMLQARGVNGVLPSGSYLGLSQHCRHKPACRCAVCPSTVAASNSAYLRTAERNTALEEERSKPVDSTGSHCRRSERRAQRRSLSAVRARRSVRQAGLYVRACFILSGWSSLLECRPVVNAERCPRAFTVRCKRTSKELPRLDGDAALA